MTDRPSLPHEPVERIEGEPNARVAFTCEHASRAILKPWSWPSEDAWILAEVGADHWAWDRGAADLTRELAAHFSAPATLAGFSRLLVDPNRRIDSDTLFRTVADGRPIHLNRGHTDAGLSADEREARVKALYDPYHAAVRAMAEATSARLLFSVHSFTPVYEGQPRSLEVGVLWDQEDDLGHRLVGAIADAGFEVAANEPYSGKEGFAWSVEHHASETSKAALEIEVRQDLIVRPEIRRRLIEPIEAIL